MLKSLFPVSSHRALAILPTALVGALAVLCLLCASAASTSAQEAPELVTDRPDQTESTAIVPAGRAQLELGATLTRDEEAGSRVESLGGPGSLLRLGLSERVELRLGWEGWVDEETRSGGGRGRVDGAADAAIGAKLRLREGDGASPAIALIAATSVPIGEEAFSSERFDPSARLAVSHDLAGGIGLGWNVGIETASEPAASGRTTRSTAIYTLAAGFPAAERWGLFVELFGEVPMSAEGGPAHSADGGATYLLRPNLQLDLAAGVGLSDAAPDWFAGVGLSVRLSVNR